MARMSRAVALQRLRAHQLPCWLRTSKRMHRHAIERTSRRFGSETGPPTACERTSLLPRTPASPCEATRGLVPPGFVAQG